MKIIFLSDTHLGFDFPLSERRISNNRGEDFFKSFESVLDFAKKDNADLVLHGGDLFYRSKVPYFIRDRVYDMISTFTSRTKIPFCIVPGNHERSKLPESLFIPNNQFYCFDNAESFDFENVSIFGFPYENGKLNQNFTGLQNSLLKNLDVERFNILVMHHIISGSKVENHTFHQGDDVIDIKDISEKFDLVLCGHIHRHQVLQKGKRKIIYSGSTERTSTQEINEIKGFVQIIISDKSYNYKFIPLYSRPMFKINGSTNLSEFEYWYHNLKEVEKKGLFYIKTDKMNYENSIKMKNLIEKNGLVYINMREM
ncbi:MAG: DNA repair exonuclease [Candidatus Delongbacteria bacterium]|nr:DNA repair exonuclease [Candidatus Delongbacteria bacterium]MBN2836656.1 DNA repair exonuclease [Candidatus Delongbacteria bacterium]